MGKKISFMHTKNIQRNFFKNWFNPLLGSIPHFPFNMHAIYASQKM